MTLLRTSLAAPVVACTTGRKTPRTSTVTSTVAIAAKLGIALRLRARSASRKKKIGLNPVRSACGRRTHAWTRGPCRRPPARRGGGGARLLVADDLAVGQLDHAAAHLVHHRHVVRGDHDRRARLVDAV